MQYCFGKDVKVMENQIDWAQVISIMGRGFGAVCVIMVMLALVTAFMGKILTRLEKPKEEQNGVS